MCSGDVKGYGLDIGEGDVWEFGLSFLYRLQFMGSGNLGNEERLDEVMHSLAMLGSRMSLLRSIMRLDGRRIGK